MSSSESKKRCIQHPGPGTTLQEILHDVAFSVVYPEGASAEDLHISDVTCDSRLVEDSSLFFAICGTRTDGHRFVEAVSQSGCAAIVVERGAEWSVAKGWKGFVVEVEDSRCAYAAAAESYHGRPADSLKLVAITGTNGKTTITYLLEDVLTKLGFRVGVIGTVNYRYSGKQGKVVHPSPFTTPEAMQLQALLSEMVSAGVEYVIMEVSSHALDQQRIGNIKFDVGAFTNLSHDHLDYHVSMEQYFQAKTVLFKEHLKKYAQAVISIPQQPGDDESWSERLIEMCSASGVSVLQCGRQAGADVQIVSYDSSLNDTTLELQVDGKLEKLSTPLVGHYNVDNLVTALTLIKALGLQMIKALSCLADSAGAPGRLERVVVDDQTDFDRPVVFVDYAHTPDALRQVLKTVAALPHRELYCIFGCGGDRDNSKRSVMGSIAGKYADVAIVTDDNPRTEDPGIIRAQIVPGVEKWLTRRMDSGWLSSRTTGEKGFVVIGDRKSAIKETVQAAGPGDIVVIAGKGHEKYQLGIDGKRYFDDVLEAQTALLGWNLKSVALATGGKVIQDDGRNSFLGSISTDSRTLSDGDIFVPLVGEKFDGHSFLHEVVSKGSACLVIEESCGVEIPPGVSVVEVPDTLAALAALARFRRQTVRLMTDQQVVAITGSCGKTTVKEMVAAILRRKWPAGPDNPDNAVLATKGNLNNLIGLPLTLLPLTPHQRAVVLEMGMNVPGEIEKLARIAEPDICCITNVHGVHLEGLGDIEGVAAAKEELFSEAGADSILVINLDDPHIRNMMPRYSQAKITFTAAQGKVPTDADMHASHVQTTGGVITFTLHYAGQSEDIHLYTVGLHNVANAITAAAIAMAAGVSMVDVAAGLADFRPADRRMVQLETATGLGVLNDTYNANPASMEAGLKTLTQMGAGKTAAILGDMLELGDVAETAHFTLGRIAGQLGVNYLGVVGKFKKDIFAGATDAGMQSGCVRFFDDKDKASEWIEKLEADGELARGDWLLVKASRGLQMETIVARLTGKT